VVLVFEPGVELAPDLEAGKPVRLGMAIAKAAG
jgi:hypothetical protein